MRVLLVEDHVVLAQGLEIILAAMGWEIEAIAGGLSVNELLDQALRFAPDVILLDLHLEGQIGDTINLIRPLRAGGASVVILTGEQDLALLGACIEAGASGVAAKSQPLEEITDLIERAARGDNVISVQRLDQLLAAAEARKAERRRLAIFDCLSRRERAVLAALMDGYSAEAVARMSYVSIATVRSHIRSILVKLDVGSQLQAVAMARQTGWKPDAPD
jgi:two-component system, NarL family, nitrate/nitrite response regulator NarL